MLETQAKMNLVHSHENKKMSLFTNDSFEAARLKLV
jgi:hypothetical protein